MIAFDFDRRIVEILTWIFRTRKQRGGQQTGFKGKFGKKQKEAISLGLFAFLYKSGLAQKTLGQGMPL